MALIYAHKKAKMIDKESVQELEARLKQTRTSCGENALYFAAMFLWHTGRHDKAREYVDRMLKMSNGSKEGAVLRGWIDLTSGRDSALKKSAKFFDDALQGSDTSQNIDALLGKAAYLVRKNNFTAALEFINKVVVSYPEFEPALVEKMKIQLALQDWEQTMDVAQRCSKLNRYSLEVHKMKIMFLLCRDGKYDEAAEQIGELIQCYDRYEPKSHYLYYEAGKLFSRVCGRNPLVLQQTFELIVRAQTLSESTAEYAVELGNQLVMQKKVRDAMKSYRTAMKLDETSVPALTGIINCQLLENMVDDAEQQLEFLSEIQQSIGKSAELSYLGAVLARKKERRFEEVIVLLNESTDSHFKELQGIPLGFEYFLKLNPEFLLQVIEEYLIFAPNEPQSSGQPVSPMLKRCAAVLDPLTKATPGVLQGLYLMAKVRYLSGDIETAKTMLNHCLEKHDRFSEGHLLMAQIHLKDGNYRMADQSLEVGLSYNFQVRDSPQYHLIKACVHKNLGNHEECIKTLNTAMALPGVKKAIPAGQGGKKASSLTLSDRVSVYLELAGAHSQLNHGHEAAKIMQDAMNEFSGTSEEVRISIANADLFLKRGDHKEALTILRSVTPEQSYFIQAREKMADIYLNHRKDKRLYASCY
ncbi:tetratricopeptide repeat 21B-like, partial [Paramuricea clavata]